MTPATATITLSAADAELIEALSAHLAADQARSLAERCAWLSLACQLSRQHRGPQ